MNGGSREFDKGQNIAKRITLTFLGLATFLIFLGGNDEFVYSQIGEQLGSIPNSNETSLPSSSNSSESPSGFVSKGTINTLITVPNGKWLAAGNWSLTLNNGNVTSFDTKMTWYNSSGTNAHTHELTNFRKAPADVQTSPVTASAKQIVIKGISDVGANGKTSWTEIPTTISINDRKIISIAVDDTKTNRHFGGQPLLGIVDLFTPCSDLPGPNMELLPSCSISAIEDETFGQSNESLGLPSEGFLPYQGAPPGGEFPQQGFPEQGFPGGEFPSEDSQTGSGSPQQVFPGGEFPSDSQTGSGSPQQGFPGGEFPSDSQTGLDFPTEDDQTQGGHFPTEDNQSRSSEINPECEDLNIENVTASGFESDPSDYHPPSDAFDGDSSTWWSNNGKDPWLEIDLAESQSICGISVQWNKGDSRDYSFEIGVSEDGNDFQKVFEGNNNKGSSEPETYSFEKEVNGQYIRLTITDSSSGDGWVSIQEIGALGMALQ